MKWHRGHPGDCALKTPKGSLSYAELDEQVAARIETFRQVGIGAGQRIALLQHTSADYIISLLALIERGVLVCPLNSRWPEAMVYEAMTQISAPFLQDVLEQGHSTRPIEASPILSESRWATLLFTSGSSGTPKAAVHSLANHRASAQASNRNITLHPGDHWLLSLPLYHVGGLGVLFRCLEAGATVVVPDPKEDFAAQLDHNTVSHISMVSTQLYRALQDESTQQHLANMKAVLMGGGALLPHLIQQACAAGIPIYTSYGMTEMTSQITCTPADAPGDTLASAGRPLIDDSVRVNASGEIEVRGETLFQGYWQEDSVQSPLNPNGFFSTGDSGYFDAQGNLCITGRIDRQFISGGENIQPAMIEQALGQLDGVLQAVVIGVEEVEFGHRPVAFIRYATEFKEEILKAQLMDVLPGYMLPMRLLPWPEDLDEGMKPTAQQWQDAWKRHSSE